ncbi:MBL fold hydrolase [Spirochaetia bacterium]|nr:MBL fold hydrolase [Spirochaetia bacterium]
MVPIRIPVGELQTNCWIIPLTEEMEEPGTCILVDPGDEGGRILAQLTKLKLQPRCIVLTHGHFDHVAALPELAAAFPHVTIAIHTTEQAKLGPGSLELHRRDFAAVDALSYVDARWKPLPAASLFLNEGDSLEPFTVLHLPGHSPGSIGLYQQTEKILISGDTLFFAGVGRTDLAGGDEQQLNHSLARLFTLDGDTAVYPGHGPATTIRRERAR